jgi:hypothetical protein
MFCEHCDEHSGSIKSQNFLTGTITVNGFMKIQYHGVVEVKKHELTKQANSVTVVAVKLCFLPFIKSSVGP